GKRLEQGHRAPGHRLRLSIGTKSKGRLGALFYFTAAALLLFATPLHAQPKLTRIGLLTLGVSPTSPYAEALREALRNFGYIEGKNAAFEYRFAQGQTDALPALADELVKLP